MAAVSLEEIRADQRRSDNCETFCIRLIQVLETMNGTARNVIGFKRGKLSAISFSVSQIGNAESRMLKLTAFLYREHASSP